MGKWSHMKKDDPKTGRKALEQAPPGSSSEATPERLARVAAQKEIYRQTYGRDKESMAKRFAALDIEHDLLDDYVKYLKEKKEALGALMVQAFEDDGITMFKGADVGGSFIIKDMPFASITDPDAFNAWIHETGQDALRKVQWQTVNAITKARLEEGKEAPPGTKVAMKTTIERREK